MTSEDDGPVVGDAGYADAKAASDAIDESEFLRRVGAAKVGGGLPALPAYKQYVRSPHHGVFFIHDVEVAAKLGMPTKAYLVRDRTVRDAHGNHPLVVHAALPPAGADPVFVSRVPLDDSQPKPRYAGESDEEFAARVARARETVAAAMADWEKAYAKLEAYQRSLQPKEEPARPAVPEMEWDERSRVYRRDVRR
jgi:hypothetical protein